VNGQFQVKLADFGLSKRVEAKQTHMMTRRASSAANGLRDSMSAEIAAARSVGLASAGNSGCVVYHTCLLACMRHNSVQLHSRQYTTHPQTD
jgi:hypothetical protein